MLNEIKQVQQTAEMLHSEQEVEHAIDKMADQINQFLGDRNPVLLCAMNGGIVTTGKLLTRLNFPLTVDAVNASRYRNATSGGDIKWLLKPVTPLQGRTVLIVDDILDEGYTLDALIQFCQEQGAPSVYSAVLVDKKLNRPKPVTADFVGLEVEDRYLFGYGMDYKGYLRNAAGIFACKETS
ncbi:hypoxanthine-guanine phosphoribosyltransferase [Methylomarinum vadi]|uniref:hypoxanthine-guanine phosphoribosyltransferase n=1 Tax=Methylomarinum vadi TaxID=438855 RepID=UPI0004DFC1FA|nr:hypoxanthine-guanine phosphoribosyltransferase [Methylomarinum vadi]